jgi:hypothetical protein
MRTFKSHESKLNWLLQMKLGDALMVTRKTISPFMANLTLLSRNTRVLYFVTVNIGMKRIGRQKDTNINVMWISGIPRLKKILWRISRLMHF